VFQAEGFVAYTGYRYSVDVGEHRGANDGALA